ncbi:Hypothetical predicted protein [Pelobates cultripes]|uniref:Uncharacterized protein n=1 Tax=Pelobates cultripes TaxID=61616 RepID=A0AAD1W7K8_PELCU|nr:Hypothetical predicted protein [Pelobates cultripes]
MEHPKVIQYIPRRTLESEFPSTNNSGNLSFLHGYSCPTLHQAVRTHSGPMGVDVKTQLLYTGKNRETYEKWKQGHSQREREALPHASSQHLRETVWYDPCLTAQYLQSSPRWGTFQWRDRPIPGKEFVLNRHKFGVQK